MASSEEGRRSRLAQKELNHIDAELMKLSAQMGLKRANVATQWASYAATLTALQIEDEFACEAMCANEEARCQA